MIDDDPVQILRRANPIPLPEAQIDPDVQIATSRMILAVELGSPPRRRNMRGATLVGMVAVGAVVLGLSLNRGTETGALPGAVNALADAVQQPSAVLHTIDDGPHVADAAGGPKADRVESWTSVDGQEQRTRTTFEDGRIEDLLDERRGDQYRISVYRSKQQTLYIAPWLKRTDPPRPQGVQLSVATIQDYAAAIDGGHARLDGQTEVDGKPALRVVDTTEGPADGTVWYVSTNEQRPALLRIQWPCRDHDARCPAATMFSTYEVVSSRDNLRLPDYPGAREVRGGSSTTP